MKPFKLPTLPTSGLIAILSAQLLGAFAFGTTELYKFSGAKLEPYQMTDVYGNKSTEPNIRLLSLELYTRASYGHSGSRRVLSQRIVKAENTDTLPRIEVSIQNAAEADCDEQERGGFFLTMMAPYSANIQKMPIYLGLYEFYVDGVLFGTLEIQDQKPIFTENSEYANKVKMLLQQESAGLRKSVLQVLSEGKIAKGENCQITVKNHTADGLNFVAQFDREEQTLPSGDILIRPATTLEMAGTLEVQQQYYCENGKPVMDQVKIDLNLKNRNDQPKLEYSVSMDQNDPSKLSLMIWIGGKNGRSCWIEQF
jgi:hypothetical protein